MAGIGMNKGRGVARAKAGIGVPKRAAGPNTAKYTTPKTPASGPMRGNLKGFDIGKGVNPPAGLKRARPTGPGRGGQMKKMGGK